MVIFIFFFVSLFIVVIFSFILLKLPLDLFTRDLDFFYIKKEICIARIETWVTYLVSSIATSLFLN
jgi:hypothetical protein